MAVMVIIVTLLLLLLMLLIMKIIAKESSPLAIYCVREYMYNHNETPKGDVEDGGGVIVGGEVYINYVHQKE